MTTLPNSLIALSIAALTNAVPACADEGLRKAMESGSLVLTFENDIFAVTDRNYSNGVKASYTTPRDVLPGFIYRGIDALSLKTEGRDWYATYGIGQRIFTPTDITIRVPDPTDHPYVGHAFLSFALSSVTGRRLDTLRLEVGITGEGALAEETQTIVHSLVGADSPRGWSAQLPSAPTIGLTYEIVQRHQRIFAPNDHNKLLGEVLLRATASLGTFDTYAGGGLGIRFGQNYPDDFGAAHIRPGAIGSGVHVPRSGFGWSVFAGVDARLIGHAGAINGALFNEGGSARANRATADLSFGATISYDRYELSYAHVIRSETFRGQDGTHQFGAVNLRVQF